MSRFAVVWVCLAAGTLWSGSAAGADPVRERLSAAKAAYDKEMAQFRTAVEEWLDKREDIARQAGDKKTVDEVKAARKRFDEGRALPGTLPAALGNRRAAARKRLEGVYAQAVKEYVRTKMDDRAEAVEKELAAILEPGGPTWAVAFPPGNYTASYDGGVKAAIELRRDGTFTRTREGKRYPGTVSSADGKLILKCEEFVEVWTRAEGRIKIEHWWPANTYPAGKTQSGGTASRSK